jgi:hypothetical protein
LGAVLFYDVDNNIVQSIFTEFLDGGSDFFVVLFLVGLEDGVSKLGHFDVILAEEPDIEPKEWDEQ